MLLSLGRQFKDTKFEKEIDFSNLTYNAIGDSITYGYDSSNGGNQMENPYPKLVKKELGLLKARNYGISGCILTSVHSNRNPICFRYKEMTKEADIISVLCGVNDYWLGDIELGTLDDTETTTIYGALNTLVKGLLKKYPDSYIFFMTPYKCGNDPGTNKMGYSLKDISNAIKEVCNKDEVDVLDLYNDGQFELEMNESDSDGLHPSQEFVEKYTAPQIAQFIKDNYR